MQYGAPATGTSCRSKTRPTEKDWAWSHTPLILADRSQGQVDLCEFVISLVYIESFRPARIT